MRDNHRGNAYAHIQHWDPVAVSQYDAGIAAKNREGCKRLREAMRAYYRKHHWGKAA